MDIKTKPAAPVQKQPEHAKDANTHKVWIGGYVVFGLICGAIYFLCRLQVFDLPVNYTKIIIKLCLAALCCLAVLTLVKITELVITKRVHSTLVHYNLVRVIRLLGFVVIVFIIISFLNSNWYTAAVSLGLISLILGFALQTPIASLIGWFYIVLRVPYKVGDRIQLNNFTGDVVEINYLDTTLWEFAGNYMTNDLPSGRLIRFPNSMVFQSQVYNYSWNKFPFIWNEIPFHIEYGADLEHAEQVMKKIAKEQLGDGMEERIKEFRGLIKDTPVDALEIKEYPFVSFRITDNEWIEALLIYLVEPKQSSAMRSLLIKKTLVALAQKQGEAKQPQ